MEPSTGIPHILPTAQVNIGPLGTAFISQLQDVYAFLLEGHTKDEAEAIRVKLQAKEPLTSWEQSLITLTALISTVHNKALEQGLVEYKSIAESLPHS